MMNPQVTMWTTTQPVLRARATRASRNVSMGTRGRSRSLVPMTCPVARAQMRSNEFISGMLELAGFTIRFKQLGSNQRIEHTRLLSVATFGTLFIDQTVIECLDAPMMRQH